MATKVRHFLNTARGVVSTAISTGKIKADSDKIKTRREICSKCQFMCNSRCQKCGCFISSKTTLEAAKCPINCW